ncbi:MAG: hypothetical protein KAW12_12810, partial [Candidatus Aminicenantes bacterium]|nr:hypothetical protein [Candidatus Aminicenantes bacterium]
GFRTPKTSDKALRAKTRKEANPANASAGFFYCKVSLGVVLILALTFIFYTWKKKKERGAGNL